MYFISSLFSSYFGISLNVYFHSFSFSPLLSVPFIVVLVTSWYCFSSPSSVTSFFNTSTKFPGLFCALLLLSSHFFVTSTCVFSVFCVNVFVIVVPSIVFMYESSVPSFSSSSTVYVIFSPFSLYTGTSFIVVDHIFSSLSFLLFVDITCSPISLFPSFRVTLIEVGRFPAWLLLSFHILLISIFCLLYV